MSVPVCPAFTPTTQAVDLVQTGRGKQTDLLLSLLQDLAEVSVSTYNQPLRMYIRTYVGHVCTSCNVCILRSTAQ